MTGTTATASRLELYWVPLGAGASVVRTSGKAYEALVAGLAHRRRGNLLHSALVAHTAEGCYCIEMAPVPDACGTVRCVVAEGAVGSRLLGRLRLFRYEVRRWLDGDIPDLPFAVGSPVTITRSEAEVREVLALIALVPAPVWGRDELRTGEMWNSNSVVAWVLARAGLLGAAGHVPVNGRVPGWHAGLELAGR